MRAVPDAGRADDWGTMIPFALPSRVIEPFALASLGVVGGCLLAHHGLRALRAVTAWRSIRPGALVPEAAGPVAARGRVALEGPLFAPLSGVHAPASSSRSSGRACDSDTRCASRARSGS
jgi:hypothetical protein